MSVNGLPNGLMGPSPRLSTNVSVQRQTPDTSFGARVQAGVNNAAGVVSGGLGLATGTFGGGIVSAAVSSMTTLSSGVTGSAANAPYGSALPGAGGGVASGVGAVGVPSVNTTVGAPGSAGIPGVGTGGTGSGPNFLSGNNGAPGTEFNGDLANMFQEQKNLLKLQTAMQTESQKYQAVSNVLKGRHDTAKNAISNLR